MLLSRARNALLELTDLSLCQALNRGFVGPALWELGKEIRGVRCSETTESNKSALGREVINTMLRSKRSSASMELDKRHGSACWGRLMSMESEALPDSLACGRAEDASRAPSPAAEGAAFVAADCEPVVRRFAGAKKSISSLLGANKALCKGAWCSCKARKARLSRTEVSTFTVVAEGSGFEASSVEPVSVGARTGPSVDEIALPRVGEEPTDRVLSTGVGSTDTEVKRGFGRRGWLVSWAGCTGTVCLADVRISFPLLAAGTATAAVPAGGGWREALLRAPYTRRPFVALGCAAGFGVAEDARAA
eukprot:m.127009 g.127009  ORF g.127009 m.127009 type:complete len:306 (+) comp52250_c0_seq1:202-1119(+)